MSNNNCLGQLLPNRQHRTSNCRCHVSLLNAPLYGFPKKIVVQIYTQYTVQLMLSQ
jgi:hypothetical protein